MSPKNTIPAPTTESFDFERLDAYRLARVHLEQVVGIRTLVKAKDQLDRASESILLNIAEGSGKLQGSKDRRRFYRIALGSAKECACAWSILHIRGHVDDQQATQARSVLLRVVAMLTRMAG